MTAVEDSLFVQACRGKAVERTPIWFMRQAGRYMAEYRQIRAKYSMLECVNTPELAAEITLQPIEAFGFDAAIIFSDILPPLASMGLELEFVKGEGPVIHNPLSSTHDIDLLATPPAESSMRGTLEAIDLAGHELAVRDLPLIGFCGAPFTLAAYAIEGGGSKSYVKTKALMMGEPAAWRRLMNKLVTVMADYLVKQARAGASALQIFDSWAGLALGPYDYVRYVHPFNRSLIEMVKRQVEVPLIYFSTGTSEYLYVIGGNGADVIGVDWRLPLGVAWKRIGARRPIMGNLDPVALQTPWRELRFRIDQVLDEAGGRPGHIFNLGHGIFPNTPVSSVMRTVDYVREKSLKINARRRGRLGAEKEGEKVGG
jgi:uroporphyrinogen decarboxylase